MLTKQTLTDVVPTSMPKTNLPFILFLLDKLVLFGESDAIFHSSEKKEEKLGHSAECG